MSTLSIGFVTGQDLRDSLDIDGGIDKCSTEYIGGVVSETATTLAVNAGAAIPKTLTHFTTQTGAAGIAQTGAINASSAGLFGAGRYASSVGGYPRNFLVPQASTIGISITNTAGYIRTVGGTYVQSTGAGAAQLGTMNGLYGVFANRNTF